MRTRWAAPDTGFERRERPAYPADGEAEPGHLPALDRARRCGALRCRRPEPVAACPRCGWSTGCCGHGHRAPRQLPQVSKQPLPGQLGVQATSSMTRRHGASQDGQKLKPSGAEHALDLAWLLLNIAIVAAVLTGIALQL